MSDVRVVVQIANLPGRLATCPTLKGTGIQ